MGVTFEGRRVATFDEIELAGDYWLNERDRALWFLLPIHQGHRYNHDTLGSGLRRITEPPWTFRECEDGSLEVRASIRAWDAENVEAWHGFLDEGNIWREC